MFRPTTLIKRQLAASLAHRLRTIKTITGYLTQAPPVNCITSFRMSSNTASSKTELDPNQGGDATKKTYNKQATGQAWQTVQAGTGCDD